MELTKLVCKILGHDWDGEACVNTCYRCDELNCYTIYAEGILLNKLFGKDDNEDIFVCDVCRRIIERHAVRKGRASWISKQ